MNSPSMEVRSEYQKIAEAWERVNAVSQGDTLAGLGAEAITSLLVALAESEAKIEAVKRVQESPVYLRTQHRGFVQEDYSRPLIESYLISVALGMQVTEGGTQ